MTANLWWAEHSAAPVRTHHLCAGGLLSWWETIASMTTGWRYSRQWAAPGIGGRSPDRVCQPGVGWLTSPVVQNHEDEEGPGGFWAHKDGRRRTQGQWCRDSRMAGRLGRGWRLNYGRQRWPGTIPCLPSETSTNCWASHRTLMSFTLLAKSHLLLVNQQLCQETVRSALASPTPGR